MPIVWLEKKTKSKGFNRVPVDPKSCTSFDEKFDPKKHIHHARACPYGGKKWNTRR